MLTKNRIKSFIKFDIKYFFKYILNSFFLELSKPNTLIFCTIFISIYDYLFMNAKTFKIIFYIIIFEILLITFKEGKWKNYARKEEMKRINNKLKEKKD